MFTVSSGLTLETKATVISSNYHFARPLDIDSAHDGIDKSFYLTNFVYMVRGKEYFDEFDSEAPYAEGETFDILVDPAYPSTNSITRRPYLPSQIITRWVLYGIMFAVTFYLLYLADKAGCNPEWSQ